MMVTFVPGFVSPKVNAWNKLQTAEQDRLKALYPERRRGGEGGRGQVDGGEPGAAARRSPTSPTTSITSARSPASITSASAATSTASRRRSRDLDDVSTYPRLTAELLRRGYSDADMKKILGLNILRVMREAEKVSKRLQAERGPSTALFNGK